MAKVLVEYVKLAAAGAPFRDPDVVDTIGGPFEIVDAIGPMVPVTTAGAPAWASESGASVTGGYAKVTVIEGAVIFAWGQEEADLDTQGVLHLRVGQKALHVQVRQGWVLTFLEAPADSIPPAAGGASEETLQEVVAGLADLTTAVDNLATAMSAPVAELPPRPLVTDIALYPTRTLIDVAGADTDELLAAVAGQRRFVFSGWLQTDIDCVITFKSAATAITKPIALKAGETLEFGDDDTDFAEIWTNAGEALNLTKSTAATVTGVLFSKAA